MRHLARWVSAILALRPELRPTKCNGNISALARGVHALVEVFSLDAIPVFGDQRRTLRRK